MNSYIARGIRRLRALAVFTGALAVALATSIAFGLDQAQLTANLALWNSHNIGDYNFDLYQDCYCAGGGPAQVKVRGDIITQVIPGLPGRPDNPEFYRTIDSLFASLQNALNSPTPYFQLEAQFDPEWGFPNNSVFHYSEGLADSYADYQVTNFTPVPEPTCVLLCLILAMAGPLCRFRRNRSLKTS